MDKVEKVGISGALLAIVWLLLGNLFGVGADAIVKWFSDTAGIYQYVFIRQVIIIVFLLPIFLRQPFSRRRLETPKIYLFRGLLTVLGSACVVVALTSLPLATAHVVFYAAPVFTLILATLWMREPTYLHRVINVILCFLGVIVALKPEDFGWGAIAGLIAALCIAIYNLSARLVPTHSSSITVLFWSTLFSMPFLGIGSLFDWREMSMDLLYLGVGSALGIGIYQICCVFAYRHADAGAVTIAEYSGLVFAALMGWLIFQEIIGWRTLLGISLIVLPILWQSRKEHKLSILKVEQEG